jgi:hypothetical protein
MSDAVLSKLKWLKLTDGHKFTGAELRVLLSIFNHSGSDGRKSHPGLGRMVAETGYGKAAVSGAVSSLKARGWIRETYRGSGTSGNASVFDLVPDAPNPPSSSPTGEQPTEGGSSSPDEQLTGSSSPPACRLFASSSEVVRPQANPSDPLSDPERIRSSSRSVDRPSDPGEVHHAVNQLPDSAEAFGLGEVTRSYPDPFVGSPVGLPPEEPEHTSSGDDGEDDLSKGWISPMEWERLSNRNPREVSEDFSGYPDPFADDFDPVT